MRPLIGVSTSEVRPAEGAHFAHQSEPPTRMLALGTAYLEAIEQAGGMPVILAPLPSREIGTMLERLDGICLSGGPDLTPSWYGAEPHPELGPTEPQLDAFELALARAARARGLPVLAVCRGLQVLNVSRGGTLIQHLPDRVGESVVHRQRASSRQTTHAVRVLSSSRLARVMGGDRVEVNSFHHQAIERLGQGLRAVAWSDDGVVEGIEAPGAAFTVGVQWHAECLTARPEHAALFGGLVEAASERLVPFARKAA